MNERNFMKSLPDDAIRKMVTHAKGKDRGDYPTIVRVGNEILSERKAFLQRKVDEDLQEWKFNNKIGHGGRPPRKALIFLNDEVCQFEGKEIPGVVEIISEEFQKKGKWSATYWRCLSPSKAEIVIE